MRKGPSLIDFKIWQAMRSKDTSKFGKAMNNALKAMPLYVESWKLGGDI